LIRTASPGSACQQRTGQQAVVGQRVRWAIGNRHGRFRRHQIHPPAARRWSEHVMAGNAMGAGAPRRGRAPRRKAGGPCRGGQGKSGPAKWKSIAIFYAPSRGKKGVNDPSRVEGEDCVGLTAQTLTSMPPANRGIPGTAMARHRRDAGAAAGDGLSRNMTLDRSIPPRWRCGRNARIPGTPG